MGIPSAQDDMAPHLRTADDVETLIARVYDAPLRATGLIEAVETWQGDRGQYLKLRSDRETPRCHHGRLASNLARARADAILTSQTVLRRHPTLDHRLQGPGRSGVALTEWRSARLGKPEPPVTLVLASGDNLDLDHPVLHHWTRPVVFTTRQAQWQLESRAVDLGVEVVGVDEPTVHNAVDFLRRAFGAATIALELEDSRALYRDPVIVNEVLLTTCQTPQVNPVAVDPPFLTAEELVRRFPRHGKPYRIQAGDDPWRLQRFRR